MVSVLILGLIEMSASAIKTTSLPMKVHRVLTVWLHVPPLLSRFFFPPLFLSPFLFSHFINADDCSKCKTENGVCNSITFGPNDLAGCHCNEHYVNSNTGGQCNKRLCDCNVRLLGLLLLFYNLFLVCLSVSLSNVLLIRALGLKIIMVFVPVPVVTALSQKAQVCYCCLAPFVHFTVRFCTLFGCLLFLILFFLFEWVD